MSVAYIVSAYKLPELLVRLVRRIDATGTVTYVHVDAKTDDATFRAMAEPLADRSAVTFLPRHRCDWGGFGHVAATLKGLRSLIASGRTFDYVVLLTGQDYPLRPGAEVAETLRSANGEIFMECMRLPTPRWTDGGTDRIENWHFRVRGRVLPFPGRPFSRPLLNAVWSLPARLFRLRRALPDGMRAYGGSSYWMLPADVARYVDQFVRYNPRFVRFFRHVFVPDEIFFQTIVGNSPFRDRLAADDRRYIAWDAEADHPKILTVDDFETLARSSDLFARKFDPTVDAGVLDRIDRILLHAAAE